MKSFFNGGWPLLDRDGFTGGCRWGRGVIFMKKGNAMKEAHNEIHVIYSIVI